MSAGTRVITGIQHHQWSMGDGWTVYFDREDGLKWCYAIPAVVLWGRSVEYGIDLADSSTLLDVVIHESVMTDYGLSPDISDPTFVYNTDAATAWTAHQARMLKAKALVIHVDTGNHLQVIHDHHAANQGNRTYREFHDRHGKAVASIRRQRQASALRNGRVDG